MDLEGAFGGAIALVFVIILGYTFTQVFLDLPGGLGWAVLFVIMIIAVLVAVVTRVIRAITR